MFKVFFFYFYWWSWWLFMLWLLLSSSTHDIMLSKTTTTTAAALPILFLGVEKTQPQEQQTLEEGQVHYKEEKKTKITIAQKKNHPADVMDHSITSSSSSSSLSSFMIEHDNDADNCLTKSCPSSSQSYPWSLDHDELRRTTTYEEQEHHVETKETNDDHETENENNNIMKKRMIRTINDNQGQNQGDENHHHEDDVSRSKVHLVVPSKPHFPTETMVNIGNSKNEKKDEIQHTTAKSTTTKRITNVPMDETQQAKDTTTTAATTTTTTTATTKTNRNYNLTCKLQKIIMASKWYTLGISLMKLFSALYDDQNGDLDETS